jgi:hypothetical protein
MTSNAQKNALQNHRSRQIENGMARFEVRGLDVDRDLIRLLAKRLAQNNDESTLLRTSIYNTISEGKTKKGGILTALLRSPLKGADLDLARPRTNPREIDL